MIAEQESILVVHRSEPSLRASIEEVLIARGWSVHDGGDGVMTIERGSLRSSVLLGAFAGSRLHLAATIGLDRCGERTVRVTYRREHSGGQALGGVLGRRRSRRLHREALAAIEERFAQEGRLVRGRGSG